MESRVRLHQRIARAGGWGVRTFTALPETVTEREELWNSLTEYAWEKHRVVVGFTEVPQEYIFEGKAIPFKYAGFNTFPTDEALSQRRLPKNRLSRDTRLPRRSVDCSRNSLRGRSQSDDRESYLRIPNRPMMSR